MEAVGIKHQILFSGKNKKNINLSSAELPKRVVKVKLTPKVPVTTAVDGILISYLFYFFL